jgi:hypothetical protein
MGNATPDPFAEAAHRRDELIRAHEEMRRSVPYQHEITRMRSTMIDFVRAVHASWLASTRDPSQPQWIFWRFADDVINSAVSVASLVEHGGHTVARRELRFVLELLIRNLYVDTVVAARDASIEQRMIHVKRLKNDDVGLLKRMPLHHVVPCPDDLRTATTRLYGELSTFVHPTHEQMARRLVLAQKGVFLGFETADELREFNTLFERACDVFLAFIFEALGPSSTGDLFVGVLDHLDGWVFADAPFVSSISATFDYKHERQHRGL